MSPARASGSDTPRAAGADALAALLVREGILPSARVEEAQERMVLSGGTLDTALLELGLIEEPRLLDLLPRAYNARGVGRTELDVVDKSVTMLFPRRLAEKHGVVPLDVSGRRLTLALAGPPDLALLDEIGFMLSVYVKPAVTTQARIASALARLYGVPVPPRLEALLPRVGADVAAVRAAVEAWQARTSHARAPSSPPAPDAAPAATSAKAEPARDHSGWRVENHVGLARTAPSAPKLVLADGGTLEANDEAKAIAERRAAEPLDHAEDARRRVRVMWTVDDAIAELALAEDRDGMLDVVMRFGYRRLGTVAAFVLARGKAGGKDAFIGWDVIDPLLTRKDIAAFTLPADPTHALGQALVMRSPFLGPLRREDPLARLFGRHPRAVVLMPILVGDKLIGVLYGDCGNRSIPPSSLAELHMVVPRLGKGLGNLILRKKKALRAAAGVPEVPVEVVMGALVEEPIGLGSADVIEIEREEDIAVSAPAPARTVPTIDIDITEVAAFEAQYGLDAPAALSSTPSGPAAADPRAALAVDAPAPERAAEPASMAWADGKGDDEDVHLDDAAWAELDAARAASGSARIELGHDAQVGLTVDPPGAPPVPIDAAPIDAAPVGAAPVDAAPVDAARVEASPAEATPVLAALVEVALVEVAPAKAAPVLAAPVLAAPVLAAPAEATPVLAALVEVALVEAAPVEAAPVEAAPVLAAPVDAAPVDAAPVDAAPVDAALIDAAPVDAALAAARRDAAHMLEAARVEGSPPVALEEAPPLVRGELVEEAPAEPVRVPGFRVDSGEGAPVVEAAVEPEAGALAPTPGARAREALLLATHVQWLGHEDALLDDLVGQLHRPGEAQRRAALAAVTAHADRAMPALARYFPGVLAVHPFGAMESRPEVEELSDCVSCLAKLGADRSAPILVAELGHHDRLHRWAAVWTLSAIHVPGALSRLAQRIFDAEPAIAAIALEVIDGYRPEPAFEKVMSQVRDLVRRGDAFERQRAIMAVGELKDREALLSLVDLLGTRPKEIAEEARRALVEITKQDFGGAERRWKAWIADNEKMPRTRWLIDGLASKDDEIRRSAQLELNRLTGQFFGFRWDAPRADREQSLAAWEEWWSAQRDAPPGKWP